MNDLFIQGLTIDWSKIEADSYLQKISPVHNLHRLEFNCPITFFAGENGSGKSTLLEALAISCGFNPEGGTKNYTFSTYDSHSRLCDAVTVEKGYRRAKWGYFLRAESFYNVATKEEEYAEYALTGSRAYHKRSHGESFLLLAQDNFKEDSIYLLDEPESALSPQRQLVLLREICRWAEKGSQFIIASHSPILLGAPDAEILSFDGDSIQKVEYEDTDSYQITKMFVEDREHLLHFLMKEL